MLTISDFHYLVAANLALLRSTRYRIAVSRRSLNPFFGVSGGRDSRLNDVARELLGCGQLPPLRGNVAWAGYGTGKICCVCGSSVQGSEVEYQVELGERQVGGCHLECFVAWQEESLAV
jgi:hypothetical protein